MIIVYPPPPPSSLPPPPRHPSTFFPDPLPFFSYSVPSTLLQPFLYCSSSSFSLLSFIRPVFLSRLLPAVIPLSCLFAAAFLSFESSFLPSPLVLLHPSVFLPLSFCFSLIPFWLLAASPFLHFSLLSYSLHLPLYLQSCLISSFGILSLVSLLPPSSLLPSFLLFSSLLPLSQFFIFSPSCPQLFSLPSRIFVLSPSILFLPPSSLPISSPS
jgi:hypothetical protein